MASFDVASGKKGKAKMSLLTRRSVFIAGTLGAVVIMSSGSAAQDAPLPDQIHTADTAFEVYVHERGENYEDCFEDFPDLRDEGLGLSMRADDEVEVTPVPPSRVFLAIDASGSMAGAVGGESKMEAARDAARQFLSGLPEDVEVGLIAFGHLGNNTAEGRSESCAAVETLYPLGQSHPETMVNALGQIEATGWTPLAAAIAAAGEGFSPSEVPGEQVVYVISDGEETCDGDPVEAARHLAESNVRAVVNIIGFDLPEADRAQLSAVADAGGGVFVEVAEGDELRAHVADAGTRLANAGALAQTSLNTTGGQAHNMLATEGMLARANLCVGAVGGRESLGLATWAMENGIDRDMQEQIRDMLEERHAHYRALIEDIEEEAHRRRREADAILQGDHDRALEDHEAHDDK